MTDTPKRPTPRRATTSKPTARATAKTTAKLAAKAVTKPVVKSVAKPVVKAVAKPAVGRRASVAPKPKIAQAATKSRAKAPAEALATSMPEVAALELYLLRHADAGDPMAWTGDDAERPLSAKGRRQSKRLGKLLADLDWRPDAILTSPKLRASQTAKLVGRTVGTKATDDDRLALGFDLDGLRAIIDAHPDATQIVLVGHDPDFSSIASTLIGAPIELRKGAIVRIDLADRGVAAGSGALRWLVPPDAIPR